MSHCDFPTSNHGDGNVKIQYISSLHAEFLSLLLRNLVVIVYKNWRNVC